jgi:hypothetical protein
VSAYQIHWYNRGRVNQGLHGIPDLGPDLAEPRPSGGRPVAIPMLNGPRKRDHRADPLRLNSFTMKKLYWSSAISSGWQVGELDGIDFT